MAENYKVGGFKTITADQVEPFCRADVIARLEQIDAFLCNVGQGLTKNNYVDEALNIGLWVMAVRTAVGMLREDERTEDDGK